MIEWSTMPPCFSRSPEFTTRFSTCQRFWVVSKITQGSPFIRWRLFDNEAAIDLPAFPTLRMAQEAALSILAQEAAR